MGTWELSRPPAIPLMTHDPGFSVWLFGDRLPDHWPRHWTGHVRSMCLIIRVDEESWSILGPALPKRADQRGLRITPTRTFADLACGAVECTLTWCSPLLPEDLDLLSRPASYLLVTCRSTDGRPHRVSVYLDVGTEFATDTVHQPVIWHRWRIPGLEVLRAGTHAQQVLGRAGDNLRTDWGYITLAVPIDGRQQTTTGSDEDLRARFVQAGCLPELDDTRQPRTPHSNHPVLAAVVNLGEVGGEPTRATFIVAYDDLFCVEFLHRKLRPYYQREGLTFGDLLVDVHRQMESVLARCDAFVRKLLADCERLGGAGFRDLCALAYRQAVAAHKLAADADGSPLFFSKENFSNGCIATVDVTYPSAPLFLLTNPALLEAMVRPVLLYASSPRWRFPFAPHDLGTFPLANGQVYGGGELTEQDQMPVEECGNLLILMAALCEAAGTANPARPWWPLLSRWADYLVAKGLDPESQLCTDDFTGHLAHNANLSLKAVIAIGAAARMAESIGDMAAATRYRNEAVRMAHQWVQWADDGDHTRLAFDRPGTWSQKYNLVWDRLLGLGLFPPDLVRREVQWYLRHQNRYGLPLDSRHTYTKNDWILWCATLAERDEDFRALVEPVVRWANETPDRVPLTDWYDTVTGRQQGFQARSVVGGFFMRLLADREIRRAWRSRAAACAEPHDATL